MKLQSVSFLIYCHRKTLASNIKCENLQTVWFSLFTKKLLHYEKHF